MPSGAYAVGRQRSFAVLSPQGRFGPIASHDLIQFVSCLPGLGKFTRLGAFESLVEYLGRTHHGGG